jgi:ABC-type molybdate transport system substrate-binding protein
LKTTLTTINSTWGNSSSPSYVSSGAYVNYYGNFTARVTNWETTDANLVTDIINSATLQTYAAGVAYTSDATAYASQLQFIPIPSAVNTVGQYGIGLINSGNATKEAAALTWEQYWLNATGQLLLQQYGFIPNV